VVKKFSGFVVFADCTGSFDCVRLRLTSLRMTGGEVVRETLSLATSSEYLAARIVNFVSVSDVAYLHRIPFRRVRLAVP